jgi:hypothetical protein
LIFNPPTRTASPVVLRNDDVNHMTREQSVIFTGAVAEGVSP